MPLKSQAKVNKRSSKKGFTLTELMVAVSTVAILSSIAGSSFGNYIKRARLAEAMLVLQKGYHDMQTYKDAHGFYPASLEVVWGKTAPDTGGRFLYGFSSTAAGGNDPFCQNPANAELCYSTFDESGASELNGVNTTHFLATMCPQTWLGPSRPANSAELICTFPTDGGGSYNLRTDAGMLPPFTLGTPKGFEFGAVGDIDNDDILHKMVINEQGALITICDDMSNQSSDPNVNVGAGCTK